MTVFFFSLRLVVLTQSRLINYTVLFQSHSVALWIDIKDKTEPPNKTKHFIKRNRMIAYSLPSNNSLQKPS